MSLIAISDTYAHMLLTIMPPRSFGALAHLAEPHLADLLVLAFSLALGRSYAVPTYQPSLLANEIRYKLAPWQKQGAQLAPRTARAIAPVAPVLVPVVRPRRSRPRKQKRSSVGSFLPQQRVLAAAGANVYTFSKGSCRENSICS